MTKPVLATLAVVLLSACATTQGTNTSDSSDNNKKTRSTQNCQEIMTTGSRLPQKVCSSSERKTGQAE
ncbi:hypothetical protein GYB61_13075 [bacterium]|nr:hypothetical protein [bacterium]